ncbi:MAG: hypothetical protein LBP19_05200 [Treponema sp.]|jgi:hypothetical protein|nr:hypothetical protein [Treponema sp.]
MTQATESEADVTAQCVQFARVNNIYLRRQNTGAARAGNRFVSFGEPGQCDYTGIVTATRNGVKTPGIHLEVEFKATGRKPSERQRAYIELVRSKGGIAFYADSLELFIQCLKREGALE